MDQSENAGVKTKLRQLRHRLASEAPRARIRPSAPPALVQRLDAALELVAGAYLVGASTSASSSKALDEVYEDAVVEAHLALHDWERWLEQEKQQRARQKTSPPLDRRQHQRHEISVAVKLLRYRAQKDEVGEVKLDSETTSRPARNASLGGILVTVSKDELPRVGVGGVVHVSVSVGDELSFLARATVQRRDASGLALGWIRDSDRVQRGIESLLDAINRARLPR